MSERNKCLEETKEEMKKKLQDERINNRSRYLETVKNLILQTMIKLLEPKLKILCREEDKDDIEGFLDELQNRYTEFMQEQTGRDEYQCELSIIDNGWLTDDKDKGCGGVIMYTDNSRITCPNMLISRLELAFEEFLPQIRQNMFPDAK